MVSSELNAWFPCIVMINHTLLFLIAVRLARSDGLSLGQLGWKENKRTWMLEVAIGILAGIAIFLIQTRISEPTVAAIRPSSDDDSQLGPPGSRDSE